MALKRPVASKSSPPPAPAQSLDDEFTTQSRPHTTRKGRSQTSNPIAPARPRRAERRLDSNITIDYLVRIDFGRKTWPRIVEMRADDLPYIDNWPALCARKYLLDSKEGSHGYGN